MATQYYTYNSETNRLTAVHGPLCTARGWVPTPTAQEWAAIDKDQLKCAYPRGNATPPTPPEGKIAVQDGYALTNGEWIPQWRYEDAPAPPPRKWSRLSIKTALAVAGKLPVAEAFLSSVEVAPDYSAWQALTDCDYVEEGYPDATRWNALLDGAAQALGKTRAEIDAFIDGIPTE